MALARSVSGISSSTVSSTSVHVNDRSKDVMKRTTLRSSSGLGELDSHRKHGYRVTVQTGEVDWLGKAVYVYIQLEGDRGKTELTKISDRQFEADTTMECVLFAPSVGNIRKLYLKHSAELGGCVMEVKRAFVLNEELQRAWPFESGAVLDWETKNEAIFLPSPIVCAGRISVRARAQELFGDSGEENAVARLIRRVVFKLNFFAKDSQNLYVLGSTPSLGEWNHERALRMARTMSNGVFRGDWYLELETDELDDVEYKYILLNEITHEVIYESDTERKVQFADEEKENGIEGGIPDDDQLTEQKLQTPVQNMPIAISPPTDEYDNDRVALSSSFEDGDQDGIEYYECEEEEYLEVNEDGELVDGRALGLDEVVASLQQEVDEISERWWKEVEERRKLFNQLQEIRGNVRVFCRCRPPRDGREAIAVDFPDYQETMAKPSEFNRPRMITLSNGKDFEFDRVFSMEEGQEAVYEDISALVISVLDGYNVCVFAYGQTGTGKTYTMNGTQEEAGINYRALDDLFRLSDQSADRFKTNISIAMLEIYNENVRDLFGFEKTKLEIKRGPGGIFVPGLCWTEVCNVQEVWKVMNVGAQNRASGATNMNEHSSRSHLVISIRVERVSLSTSDRINSTLHLVDLAGSERLSRTNATGERLREAQNINKSLSALGDVFNSILAKNTHVPFRNSKLTYLLQDALGGDAKTLMFVNVSPAENDVAETLSSLNFASRVSRAELGAAKRNVDSGERRKTAARLTEYEREISVLKTYNGELENEVNNLRQEIMDARNHQDAHIQAIERETHDLRRKLRESERSATEVNAYSEQNQKLHSQLRAAQERIRILESRAPYAAKTPPQTSPAVPHQQPTRSILAELNRAAIEETPSTTQRSGTTRPPRSSSRTVMKSASSIPRPRSMRISHRTEEDAPVSSRESSLERPTLRSTSLATTANKRQSMRSSLVTEKRRGFNSSVSGGLQRLTRPTISSSRSSSQPPTDDESDGYDAGYSQRKQQNFNLSVSLRKPERVAQTNRSRNHLAYP